jgi:hypothetical protein
MALSTFCSATQEIPRYELFTEISLTISTKQSFGDCQLKVQWAPGGKSRGGDEAEFDGSIIGALSG